MATFSENVIQELTELKRLGVKVSARALAKAADKEHLAEYENMSVTECADLLNTLY
jgi:hypothetical protein